MSPSADLRDWMITEGATGRLYIAAITIAEIERGIRKLDCKCSRERGARLADWLMGSAQHSKTASCAWMPMLRGLPARWLTTRTQGGTPQDRADVMIAATAKAHGLTVVTDNIRHFEPLDVSVQRPPE